jgi:hypothetical protein
MGRTESLGEMLLVEAHTGTCRMTGDEGPAQRLNLPLPEHMSSLPINHAALLVLPCQRFGSTARA